MAPLLEVQGHERLLVQAHQDGTRTHAPERRVGGDDEGLVDRLLAGLEPHDPAAREIEHRLAAMLDAWRLAHDPSVGSAGTRMLSTVGLVALVVVLTASHVVVGSAGLTGNSLLMDITDSEGDDSEIPTEEELVALVEKAFGRSFYEVGTLY